MPSPHRELRASYEGKRGPLQSLDASKASSTIVAVDWFCVSDSARNHMTIAPTIHCKVCHSVYALLSNDLFSHGDNKRACEICGHVIAHWTGRQMPVIKFIRIDFPIAK